MRLWLCRYGIKDDNSLYGSQNHYSPGAILAWLYKYAAGIRPLKPGFKEIEIRLFVWSGPDYVKCSYDSIAGRIVSNWTLCGKDFSLDITTPENTTVILPDGSRHEVDKGEYMFKCCLY